MRRYVAGLLAVVMLAAVGCSSSSSGTGTGTNTGTGTGSGSGSGASESVVRINIGTNPQTLDPRISTGLPEAHVEIALFEGLMRLDSEGNAIPGAAESYEANADNTVFTFHLRDGLKWSNGDPVTAEDFVWSWKSTLDPVLASEYAYQLYYIKGAEEMNTFTSDPKWENASDEEIKAEFERLAENFGAKAIDDKTIEVTLEAPTPYFLSLTAFHTYYPVHKASVEANPDGWFRDPQTTVGNGPSRWSAGPTRTRSSLRRTPTTGTPAASSSTRSSTT